MSLSPLAQAVGDLEEDKAIVLVQDKLAKGETALAILEELQAGMNIVGEQVRRRRVLPLRAHLRRRHLQEGRRSPAGRAQELRAE